MRNFFKGKQPAVIGLYFGVILGAISMMITGGLGYTGAADLSLIMGILAGPAIGWIVGKIQDRQAEKDSPSGTDTNSIK